MRFLKNSMKTNSENITHSTDCTCENCCPFSDAATFFIKKENKFVAQDENYDIINRERRKYFRECLRRKK